MKSEIFYCIYSIIEAYKILNRDSLLIYLFIYFYTLVDNGTLFTGESFDNKQ